MLTALLGWLFFAQSITLCQIGGMVLVVGSALIEPEISSLIRELFRKK